MQTLGHACVIRRKKNLQEISAGISTRNLAEIRDRALYYKIKGDRIYMKKIKIIKMINSCHCYMIPGNDLIIAIISLDG